MILIYTPKLTPRVDYAFKHICTRILGLKTGFTSIIEEFVSHDGPKLSYGKLPLGNELFIQSYGLLQEHGFDDVTIDVKEWGNTKCFFAVGDKSHLPFDIFSASFYLLSRYEEYLPHVKDEMGRFPAAQSLAFKNGFLHQPVVDIWAYEFKKLVEKQFPQLSFPNKEMAIHNIIEATEPFAYVQRGFFKAIAGYFRDFFKFRIKKLIGRSQTLLKLREDPYNTFNWAIDATKKSKNPLTIFFLIGDAFHFYQDINTQRSKFKLLVKHVMDYKEVGLIFSYNSLNEYESLRIEKREIESIILRDLVSSINAQFKVNLPDMYRNLVELELKRDFTMLYADTVGFRAGTCTPFLFFDLDYEIKTPLTLHPMVGATSSFQNMKASEVATKVDEIFDSVNEVHGTFSLLFSNQDFIQNKRNKNWRNLFIEKLQRYE